MSKRAPKVAPEARVATTPKVRHNYGDACDALLSGVLVSAILVSIFAIWAIGLVIVPSLEDAHTSMVFAQEANPIFAPVRALLWFGHSLIFVSLVLLFVTRLWRRKHGRGLRARWYWCLAALVLFGAWSFYASLLPMDQAAWHGTMARRGVIEATPYFGVAASAWLFPDGTITQSTLTHFHLMAVGVIPALILLVAIGLWCSRTRTRGGLHGLGMLLGLGAIGLAAYLLPSIVALHSSPSLEFSEVRPEWFFLPLSIMLKEAPALNLGDTMIALVALAPALILGALVLVPFLSGRWHWQLDRLIVAVVVLGFAGTLGMGLWNDSVDKDGYFAQPDAESIMTAIGKLNKAAGSEGHLDSQRAYNMVADLIVLTDQATRLADYSEDVKDPVQWREMAQAARAAALTIRQTQPDDLEAAVTKLRDSCQKCHEIYEEEAELRHFADPQEASAPVLVTPPVAPVAPVAPGETDRVPENLFSGYDAAAATSLLPLSATPYEFASTKDYRKYMKGMLKLYTRIAESDPKDVLQDLVDLRAATSSLDLEREGLRGWMIDQGYLFEEDLELWRKSATLVGASVENTIGATNLETWRAAASSIRSGCNGCHEHFYAGDEEVVIPPLK